MVFCHLTIMISVKFPFVRETRHIRFTFIEERRGQNMFTKRKNMYQITQRERERERGLSFKSDLQTNFFLSSGITSAPIWNIKGAQAQNVRAPHKSSSCTAAQSDTVWSALLTNYFALYWLCIEITMNRAALVSTTSKNWQRTCLKFALVRWKIVRAGSKSGDQTRLNGSSLEPCNEWQRN